MTIADLKPYPAMKDSGVPWLGRIPVSWSVVRNGRLFVERKETGFADLPILEVSLRSGVRVRRLDGEARKQLMSDRDKYKRACAGDLAYNMMRMWQGAAGLAPVDGLVSPAYVVARPFAGVVARYFAYLFRTDSYMGEVDQYSRGIVKDRNRLYWDQFKQMPSACPPAEEQAAIVRFLDHADRRIRRYIQAKQKLIKLLEEQKQAIIHRAVTRGLDPNVRLKPSGVEWLGEVPEHWEVRKLKYLVLSVAGIQMGPFGASLTQLQSGDTGFKLFGQENTISGDFRRGSRWLTESQFGELRRYELRPGDLVLTRKGSIGKCSMVPDDASAGIADSDTIRVRVSTEQASSQFIVMLLHHAPYLQRQIESVQRGAVLGGLNTETIAALRIAVPPRPEQDKLLQEVKGGVSGIDQAMTTVERETSLLHDYCMRMIVDVVTGKLDVREAAAALPDEADEPVPLDDAASLETDEAGDDADNGAAPQEDEA